MKLWIAPALTLLTAVSAMCQVIITPSKPPRVDARATFKFTANVPVTWAMAPGSQGTIDEDGTYHAPASVVAQQSYGGCQVLPNNHIFNTRIDSLPVDPRSEAWIEKASSGSVFYTPDFPINYADKTTPVQNLSFFYTPLNNGPFLVPGYPEARVQSGYFASLAKGLFDKHVIVIDPNTCLFQEIYDAYPAGSNSRCPTCTAQSGVKYSGTTYDLPMTGATNADGTYIVPLTLHLQEVERALATGGTINHALGVTLKNSVIAPSFIWPATAHAYAPWGVIPYGVRFRLKSSFDISKFTPAAQLLLTQLKQYGLILTDGGSQWEIGAEYTKWPAAILSAFAEIRAAVKPNDMEVVDESGLMISPSSGDTNVGGENVIATSIPHPDQKAQMPVVLTGVTVNLPKDQEYIQVGAPPERFTAYVNGTDNPGVVWSMNPIVGTLTSDGLYTPPSEAASVQTTVVTATSIANPDVAAQMTVTIFPAGPIRIVLGRMSSYTDPQGNVWQASTGYNAGSIYDNGWLGPMSPSLYLYRINLFAFGDMRFDFAVPNGTYQITGKFASTNAKTPGEFTFHIESQGQIIHPNVDLFAAAGGEYAPVDFSVQAIVTNNHLSYVLRHVSGENLSIAAIEIASSNAGGKAGAKQPAPPTGLSATVD